MEFSNVISSMKFKPREAQEEFASKIGSVIANESIGLIQADTGIGKSLGYLIPALLHLAKNQDKRLIIAIGTLGLIQQLKNKDIGGVVDYVAKKTSIKLSYSLLIGRQNYISKERLFKAVETQGQKFKSRHQTLIENLLAWDGALFDFIEIHGDLPTELAQEKICQTAHFENEEYSQKKGERLESDIIITTHAMLALDIATGGNVFNLTNDEREAILIIDEADGFYEVMASRQEKRLNLLDLKSASKEFLPAKSMRVIEEAIGKAMELSNGGRFTTSKEISGFVKDFMAGISKPILKMVKDESATRAVNMILEVNKSYPVSKGVGVSRVLNEPALVFLNPFATRMVGSYIDRFYSSASLISATLSVHEDVKQGVKWLVRDFALDKKRVVEAEFSPARYGSLKFNIADKSFPKPFIKDADQDNVDINPEWISQCSTYISALEGNVLVLTGSHRESARLFNAVLKPSTIHVANEKLSEAKEKYLESGGGILITASGHSGLDVRSQSGGQFLDHVVISRIPFNPVNESLREEYINYLNSCGFESSAVKTADRVFMQKNSGAATRKLKQAIGRGIRSEDDKASIHILDPRFPKGNSVKRTMYDYLKSVIPLRFKADYANAISIRESQDTGEKKTLTFV